MGRLDEQERLSTEVSVLYEELDTRFKAWQATHPKITVTRPGYFKRMIGLKWAISVNGVKLYTRLDLGTGRKQNGVRPGDVLTLNGLNKFIHYQDTPTKHKVLSMLGISVNEYNRHVLVARNSSKSDIELNPGPEILITDYRSYHEYIEGLEFETDLVKMNEFTNMVILEDEFTLWGSFIKLSAKKNALHVVLPEHCSDEIAIQVMRLVNAIVSFNIATRKRTNVGLLPEYTSFGIHSYECCRKEASKYGSCLGLSIGRFQDYTIAWRYEFGGKTGYVKNRCDWLPTIQLPFDTIQGTPNSMSLPLHHHGYIDGDHEWFETFMVVPKAPFRFDPVVYLRWIKRNHRHLHRETVLRRHAICQDCTKCGCRATVYGGSCVNDELIGNCKPITSRLK
jgi:hypothetical protein